MTSGETYMTAQRKDTYYYNDARYSHIIHQGNWPFHPEGYGLIPSSRCSASVRGYWVDYVIDDGKLYVDTLCIYTKGEEYPPVNGIAVSEPRYEVFEKEFRRSGKTVKEVIKFDLDFGHRRYCNLGIEVPFTGQLLIGKDVIGDFTTRFGTWYWSYETVIKLTLQNGVVTKSYDHSYTARVARRELKRQIQDKSFLDLRKLDHFIGNSLRKEYLEKTWWLK